MYQSKFSCEECWYILSGLDLQLEQSDNDKPARKKVSSRLQYATSHILFFWVGRYELMWLRRIAVSRATSIPFPQIAKTPNSPSASLGGEG